MLVNWLVAFAKLTHCSAERTFCIRKIVRLLGGSIQKKENPLDFLSAVSTQNTRHEVLLLSTSFILFYLLLVPLSLLLARGVRKANALLGWANFFCLVKKSFASSVWESKERGVAFICIHPEYSPLGLVLKICKLSFTNKHRSIYCCLARGVRKANALLGWANFFCLGKKSFACWVEVSKKKRT